MIKLRHFAIPAILLTILGACSGPKSSDSAQAPRDLLEEPVMWSITDEDSEIILYPTFHILPEGVKWQSPTLIAAINRADTVWYELPVGADQDPELQQKSLQLGMSPDRPLKSILPSESYEQLKGLSGQMSLPFNMIDNMRPWLASITIPLAQMMLAGYNPNLGVEKRLQSMITDKPTKSFETAQQQLELLALMPEADQITMLISAIENADENLEVLDGMVKAWSTGDIDFLEQTIIEDMETEMPSVYARLFVNRNKAWAEVLDAEMLGSGIDFVAVGAGHLMGKDSVGELLRQKGYKADILTQK